MKIKYENKELLNINKMLIFSDLSKYERDKILDYILLLQTEIETLKEEIKKMSETK